MKAFLTLLLFCALGFGAYLFLQPAEVSLKTDGPVIPKTIRGKYVCDVEATRKFVMEEFVVPKPEMKQKLADLFVAEIVDIGPTSLTISHGGKTETVRVKVILASPESATIERTDLLPGRVIQVRIDRDAEGAWFHMDQPLKGFRQRYKKL